MQQLVLSLAGLAQIKWIEGQQKPAAVLLGAADTLANAGDLLPFYWFTPSTFDELECLFPALNDTDWDILIESG